MAAVKKGVVAVVKVKYIKFRLRVEEASRLLGGSVDVDYNSTHPTSGVFIQTMAVALLTSVPSTQWIQAATGKRTQHRAKCILACGYNNRWRALSSGENYSNHLHHFLLGAASALLAGIYGRSCE
eukprot:gene3772-6295_t